MADQVKSIYVVCDQPRETIRGLSRVRVFEGHAEVYGVFDKPSVETMYRLIPGLEKSGANRFRESWKFEEHIYEKRLTFSFVDIEPIGVANGR